ncbi:unnamed protein product [Vicia faba]|uniref:Uncharacterized protein n=1 Tax=Vicia faba TaxID=3906 RepID=A0AAV0ZHX3_VICFA|nr:unnamed protein product [Vicia faba]
MEQVRWIQRVKAQTDWDGLLHNGADLLIKEKAFKGLMQKPLGSSLRLCDFVPLQQSSCNNDQNIHMVDSDSLANGSFLTSNPNEKMDNHLVFITHRGIRRRCLDFEMVGVRKNSDDNSNTGSSTVQSEARNVSDDKQLLPAKRNANSQKGILPGIGLHLNALAPLKDDTGIKK